ncbi:hypothetical protein [Bradyrhizobium sp. SZCCHNRI20481]|uniref:hypothetical protein n=1 Tax=Bradyrhizobium sp. SZCCHNRI20481 TaxID=3057286 RepID=UPI002916C2C7|nr:hypothetical protein [Bradyrhizobium sp. SZCCHNRI20481]
MTKEWPDYHTGRREHVHAVGVIALSYTAFERRLFGLYSHHPERQNMPHALMQLYYSSLNEANQLKAIRVVFSEYEREPEVIDRVDNILEYFDWCSDARNKLLHSEMYPAMFGGDADKLYLTKPLSKRDPASTYMWLTVEELRDIADKIEHGKRNSAALSLYLRYRDQPPGQRKIIDRILNEPLPGLLNIPAKLKPSNEPHQGTTAASLPSRRPPS